MIRYVQKSIPCWMFMYCVSKLEGGVLACNDNADTEATLCLLIMLALPEKIHALQTEYSLSIQSLSIFRSGSSSRSRKTDWLIKWQKVSKSYNLFSLAYTSILILVTCFLLPDTYYLILVTLHLLQVHVTSYFHLLFVTLFLLNLIQLILYLLPGTCFLIIFTWYLLPYICYLMLIT